MVVSQKSVTLGLAAKSAANWESFNENQGRTDGRWVETFSLWKRKEGNLKGMVPMDIFAIVAAQHNTQHQVAKYNQIYLTIFCVLNWDRKVVQQASGCKQLLCSTRLDERREQKARTCCRQGWILLCMENKIFGSNFEGSEINFYLAGSSVPTTIQLSTSHQ